MNKAHSIRLYPTVKQEILFRKSCGVARFAYNWSLNKWNEYYKDKQKTSAYDLIKELTKIKREEFPWMMEVSKTCPQYAIHNMESAFKNFFKKNCDRPKFKKKGIKDSFVAVENKEAFNQKNYKIHIPKIGKVKCAENLRFKGSVNNVIVKRVADKWFAVVNIGTLNDSPVIHESQVVVGVDLGIKSLAITSDGQVFENPKALKNGLCSLKRQQRSLSRKVKGSKNRVKQQMKVAKVHYRISCIRKNALHKATTSIVNSATVIVIEDLNVSGMSKNKTLSLAIGDVGFGEFRRQIEYKAKWQNKQVIVVDRFFASSKTCSYCGWKNNNLKLIDRTFICLECNLIIDRDLNASLNLQKYGTAKLAESILTEKACGEGSSSVVIPKSPSLKQELNLITNSIKN